MAKKDQEPYRKLARRALTPNQLAQLSGELRVHRGMYATRRLRPRFWATIGKTLGIAALTAMCGLFVLSGTLADVAVVLGGGVSGTVTVDSCHRGSKSTTCTGTFVAADHRHPLVIDSVVVEGGGRTGATVSGRVSGPRATHLYPAWSSIPLIPLSVFSGALLALLLALVCWPVRSAVHLWRPDVWPYWIGPSGPPRKLDRTPRVVQLASTVAYWWGGLTMVAFFFGFVGALAGPYGIGALVLIGVLGAAWYLVKKRGKAGTAH